MENSFEKERFHHAPGRLFRPFSYCEESTLQGLIILACAACSIFMRRLRATADLVASSESLSVTPIKVEPTRLILKWKWD
ncbi:hypothetical protein J7E62_29665 [Variovorax paradoxus]|nr:hypothetical protein [Variovorax paradoxus]